MRNVAPAEASTLTLVRLAVASTSFAVALNQWSNLLAIDLQTLACQAVGGLRMLGGPALRNGTAYQTSAGS
jgi:hypothetical protein